MRACVPACLCACVGVRVRVRVSPCLFACRLACALPCLPGLAGESWRGRESSRVRRASVGWPLSMTVRSGIGPRLRGGLTIDNDGATLGPKVQRIRASLLIVMRQPNQLGVLRSSPFFSCGRSWCDATSGADAESQSESHSQGQNQNQSQSPEPRAQSPEPNQCSSSQSTRADSVQSVRQSVNGSPMQVPDEALGSKRSRCQPVLPPTRTGRGRENRQRDRRKKQGWRLGGRGPQEQGAGGRRKGDAAASGQLDCRRFFSWEPGNLERKKERYYRRYYVCTAGKEGARDVRRRELVKQLVRSEGIQGCLSFAYSVPCSCHQYQCHCSSASFCLWTAWVGVGPWPPTTPSFLPCQPSFVGQCETQGECREHTTGCRYLGTLDSRPGSTRHLQQAGHAQHPPSQTPPSKGPHPPKNARS
jgi:hypothetical protein